MIIVNGQTKTLVVFGEVKPQDYQEFMELMAYSIMKWHRDGCPPSGGAA